jgi:hypothetical protein
VYTDAHRDTYRNMLQVCFNSFFKIRDVTSSRLLSTNVKIRIYMTIIFPVVLYVCET